MRIFSYVVARDYGFAPNPFHGACTLATCKPLIRRVAQQGDWVLGTGSATYGLQNRLVYAMRVSEALTYTEYFDDPRYQAKKPNLSGSLKQAFGDNIYRRTSKGGWQQLDSHHSLPDGTPNERNIANDTQTDRVLIAESFVYFGADAIAIPDEIRCGPETIVSGRGYRSRFSPDFTSIVAGWINQLSAAGAVGRPSEWPRRRAVD